MAGACGGGSGGEAPALEVYAASSLRDALVRVVEAWEARGGGPVALNFGSSGGLARQILAARRADVFVSAGELEMDRVEAAGLVVEGTRRGLLVNRLVVIEPVGRESLWVGEFQPAMLADVGVEYLSMGDPEYVPAGRYAREWLEREGLWEQVEGRVAPAVDVRAALAAVESGVARAGVVYATDAAISERVRVVYVVPEGGGARAVLILSLDSLLSEW